MRMKKALLLAVMTAALGSMNMFAAFADVDAADVRPVNVNIRIISQF